MYLFFSCDKLANKWVCLCHCVSELVYCRLQTIGNISSLHLTQILDTKACIKEQIHFLQINIYYI